MIAKNRVASVLRRHAHLQIFRSLSQPFSRKRVFPIDACFIVARKNHATGLRHPWRAFPWKRCWSRRMTDTASTASIAFPPRISISSDPIGTGCSSSDRNCALSSSRNSWICSGASAAPALPASHVPAGPARNAAEAAAMAPTSPPMCRMRIRKKSKALGLESDAFLFSIVTRASTHTNGHSHATTYRHARTCILHSHE